MSLHVPHVPEPANAAADKFARLLDSDGYGPTAAMRMIAAIVDHARAVRLRCDARAHLNRMRGRNGHSWDASSSSDHIVHGLAKHTAIMTRRDLPRLRAVQRPRLLREDWEERVAEISEPTRDAGHDLLASLICEVDCG